MDTGSGSYRDTYMHIIGYIYIIRTCLSDYTIFRKVNGFASNLVS